MNNTTRMPAALSRRLARAWNSPAMRAKNLFQGDFIAATEHARTFEDIAPRWQKLILEAEAGHTRQVAA